MHLVFAFPGPLRRLTPAGVLDARNRRTGSFDVRRGLCGYLIFAILMRLIVSLDVRQSFQVLFLTFHLHCGST